MSIGAETKEKSLRRFRLRSITILAILLMLVGSLVIRALYLQIYDRDFLISRGERIHIGSETIFAHRGSIKDRNGELLAISSPVDAITANPRMIADNMIKIQELAEVLDMDHLALEKKISDGYKSGKQEINIKRRLSPEKADQVMALGFPGVDKRREYDRYYPAGEVTAHLVGLTMRYEDKGIEGLEVKYNDVLKGKSGKKTFIRDNKKGKRNKVQSIKQLRPPIPGKDIETSIDLRLQYLAYKNLKKAIKEYNAASGSIIILDAKTNEVLALVNQPSYNPNDRSQYTPESQRNRAVTDIYEPGSTIKPLILTAALESGKYSLASIIDTSPGSIKVGSEKIEDPDNLGSISFSTVLTRSSNVGATKIALSLDAEQLWDTLTRFGFGSLTLSNFPAESPGRLYHHSNWRNVRQATISYGYGLSVTPMQLARAYAVFGAEGILRPISLLKMDEPKQGVPVVDSEIAKKISLMLEEVVHPGGTGIKARVPSYRIGGKTGTAWLSKNGNYSKEEYISTFVGIAPLNNPRLVVLVKIDKPQGLYYGSDVAAPIFSEVTSAALRLLGVPPDLLPEESIFTHVESKTLNGNGL